MKLAVRSLLAICLTLSIAGCAHKSRPAVSESELHALLAQVESAPGATLKSEDHASGKCAAVTQTYSYTGTTADLLAHYQATLQPQGWSPVGKIASSGDPAQASYLKDKDGEPLFLQVTDNRENDIYTLLIRGSPPAGGNCQ